MDDFITTSYHRFSILGYGFKGFHVS